MHKHQTHISLELKVLTRLNIFALTFDLMTCHDLAPWVNQNGPHLKNNNPKAMRMTNAMWQDLSKYLVKGLLR